MNVAAVGDYNAITATGTGSGIFVGGTGDTITASSSSIYLYSNTQTAANLLTVNGTSNTISLVANWNVTLTLSGNAITATGGTITLSTILTETLTGSGSTVTMASGGTLYINGGGQFADANAVTLSNGTLILDHDARANLTGSGNHVTVGYNDNVGVTGDNNILTATGSGDGVWVGGTNNAVTISNGSVYVGGLQTQITGNNDAITLYGGIGATINGNNEVISVNGPNTTVALSTNGVGPSGELDLFVTHDQVWLQKSGNDLVVDLNNGTTETTLTNWFLTGGTGTYDHQVANIKTSDGYFLSSSSIDTLLSGSNTTASSSVLSGYWHT
ncbi:hypothetical protein AZA_90038 [Nitrospirillum viridazoti Y2]|nr:hypothetical protein AZA_90038 [Nitrospirillum amazonense Y2]